MKDTTIRKATTLAALLTARATYIALALTAVTLPVAFAQTATTKATSLPDANDPIRIAEHVAQMPVAKIGNPTKAKKFNALTAPKNGNGISTERIDIGNVNTTKWESIGPFGSRVTHTPPLPGDPPPPLSPLGVEGSYVAGRVNAVAYDTKNPTIFYVASAGGGLWRYNPADTTSPTTPWRPLGDKFPSLATYSVAVSPTNPKIVMVGTGAGIQRSINSGNTFVSVGAQLGRVTRIVFDPDTTNTLYATAFLQGLPEVGIYKSTDLGNTWVSIAPGTRITNNPPPYPPNPRPIGEEWIDLEISLPDDTGSRYLYATSRRGGLYRSDDRGASWQLVNAPLVYNPVSLLLNDPYTGKYGIEVAVSATDPYTVYVMDSNGGFSDGKIFVSKDAGDSWTEIGGNYPTAETPDGGSNVWTLSYQNLGMIAIPTLLELPLPEDAGTFVSVDALLGATRDTYSAEHTSETRADPNNPSGPIQQLSSFFSGRDWLSVGDTHINQHGFSYNALDANSVLAANDGGIYKLTYDSFSGTWRFTDNRLNRNLAATEFYGVSFHPTLPLNALGGTINNGATRLRGNKNDWSQILEVPGAFTATQMQDELAVLTPPVKNAPATEEFTPGMYVGSTAYDPNAPATQYIMNESRDGNAIYVTTNNWVSGWEITPTRVIKSANGGNVQTDTGADITVFPQVNAQSTTTATNWAAEQRRPQGILVPDPSGSNNSPGSILYTGGHYLWRYDLRPGYAIAANAANIDRGTWRRVGTTQLAVPETVNGVAEQDYITAIAVSNNGQRVYVGTRLGRLWMTRFPRAENGTTPIPDLIAPWIRLDNATLPTRIDPPTPALQIRREITAISVNPDNPSSDILVGVAEIGLYRCANTFGENFLFTNENGSGTTGLPGSQISAIARDTVTLNANGSRGDATNSWLVGTTTGVYATNNQGTTWADATVPLGLPSVPITAMDLNTRTGYLSVATSGRGAWRFNLRGATETVVAPKLAIKYALSRNAGTIYGNITVENSGGQAADVRITEVALIARNATTQATGISPTTPVLLGTIGTGPASSRSTTATWGGAAGGRGEVVTLRVSGTYANGGTFGLNVRTRLP